MNRACVAYAISAFFAAAACPGLQADVVILAGKPPFKNVQITDCRSGKISFRGVSGESLRKGLQEVESLACERSEYLTEAEQEAQNQRWGQAISAYDRALPQADQEWLRVLVRLRRMRALDAAGRFDSAVEQYVELIRETPQGLEPLLPRRLPVPGHPAVAAAARCVQEARTESTVADNPILARLLLELLIYQDSPNVAAARTTQSASQPTADDEDEDAPRLFAQPISRRPSGTLPQAELTRHSALLDVARSAGSREDAIAAGAWLERGLPFVARADVGVWRLAIARSRLAAGQDAAAAADFVRLAESPGEAAVRAEARYYAGLAHEKLGRLDVAAGWYAEAVGDAALPAGLRDVADAALRRVRP